MEIRRILVNLDVDNIAPAVLASAVDLAERFGATITGFAAAQPSVTMTAVDGGAAAAAWYAEERAQIEKGLQLAEERFRATVPAALVHKWRGLVNYPTKGLSDLARGADLIVLGSSLADAGTYARRIDIGELVLSAARPVLLTGAGVDRVAAKKVFIAWKDRREARRAVADALPFLKLAEEVLVATVDEGDFGAERLALDELGEWLDGHGVAARTDVVPLGESVGASLEQAASAFGADLMVSGAYGHSRLREWLLGGATRDLLANRLANRFLSA